MHFAQKRHNNPDLITSVLIPVVLLGHVPSVLVKASFFLG